MTTTLPCQWHHTIIPRTPDVGELSFFAEHGYLSWGPLLGEPELSQLRCEYDRLFQDEAQAGIRDLGQPREDVGQERQKVLQIMQLCERSLIFRKLLYDERILQVVRAILGPDLLLFHDQAFLKPAHIGGVVSWHQDNGYWQCQPPTLVSCWIALDDATAENGAMQVIPGSHRTAAAHHDDPAHAHLQRADTASAQPLLLAMAAGSCLFHHCQTLHFTGPNVSPHPRRAFAIHYLAQGTRDRDGHLIRASWAHPQLSQSQRR